MGHRRVINWFRDHPDLGDLLLAVVISALAVSGHLLGLDETGEARDPSWWTLILILGASFPVVARRRAPVAAAILVVLFQAACEVFAVLGTGWTGVVVVLYSLGAHAEGRQRVVGASASVGILVTMMIVGVALGEIGLAVLIISTGVIFAALVFGDSVQQRRLRLLDLAERAERAERENELVARERVREERTRIARELHDVVAHSVSMMVVQTGAARRNLTNRPEDAAVLLGNVEQIGRNAMDELRRVLGVLREPGNGAIDPDRRPQPGLDALADLVSTEVDLPVHLEVEGEVSHLPTGVSLSAYRLIQEALTNVRRHAGSVTEVHVLVQVTDGCLSLQVDDDGRGASSDLAGQAGGFGILGMGERVSTLGGTFAAGPRQGGGWRVHAQIPVLTVTHGAHVAMAPATQLWDGTPGTGTPAAAPPSAGA